MAGMAECWRWHRARSVYTANSSLTHEKALCEWCRLSEPVQAERGSGNTCSRKAKFWLAESFYPNPGQRRFAELFLLKLLKWTVFFFWNEFYRCRGNTLTMCEFHESTCNGFGDIWWRGNPIYFSGIDIINCIQQTSHNSDFLKGYGFTTIS